MTVFAVLGSGAWGTTIALLLAQKPQHQVRLWSARALSGEQLQRTRLNPLLPGVPIPESIELTTDVAQATQGADLLIAAIPTVYLRQTLVEARARFPFGGYLGESQEGSEEESGNWPPVLSLAKGLEIATFLRPTQILREVLGVRRLAVLSGPSHAEEVSRGLPTSVVIASEEVELARWTQRHLRGERFRVYTNLDPIGVEMAGALKNVLGIAAGICDGLGFGDNALSALLTRGLAEITRFGVALGAEAATFAGLAGLGDLITTCISPHGRNRRVGQRLARGEHLSAILQSTLTVAEGVYTTRSVYERARRMDLELPIISEVYRVLYEGKDPRAAVVDLMVRSPKEESWPP